MWFWFSNGLRLRRHLVLIERRQERKDKKGVYVIKSIVMENDPGDLISKVTINKHKCKIN